MEAIDTDDQTPILQSGLSPENNHTNSFADDDADSIRSYESFPSKQGPQTSVAQAHEEILPSSNSLPSSYSPPLASSECYNHDTVTSIDNSLQSPLKDKRSTSEEAHTEVKVYKRRWYILVMFSLFSNVQTAVWQTWGPISNSSERVFGWSDSTIALLNNFGPIAYILAGILFPWLLQVKGLRAAILGSALLTSLGCTFRVISDDPHTASILIYIGQLLNGASGPMAMGAMPYLSATWFPVHERVTATAIASSVGYFGTAVSFVVGPALVSDNSNSSSNHTNGYINNTALDAIIDKEKNEILNYMYYSCGVAWLITIIILAYFPAKPPLPPCISAVVQRDSFWQGVFSLRKKKYFIFIAITYGMSVGVTNTWVTVLNIILGKFNVSQSTAGWIGFYATVASCLTAMIIGKFADYFARMMKLIILIMYVVGAVFMIVFTLMFIEVIPYNEVLLWVTVIGGMTAINGAVPLLFELACEMAFPTGEGPTTGVLTYINNVFGLIFLILFFIPDIGKTWMNWTLIAAIVLSLPLIGFMKGRMKRLDIDEKEEKATSSQRKWGLLNSDTSSTNGQSQTRSI